MIQNRSDKAVDVVLIAPTEITMGIRSLSSFLKAKGYRVVLGFFNAWGDYTEHERAGILQWAEAMDPKIFGISSVEAARSRTRDLARAFTGMGKPVVVGGVDASVNPEQYLDVADFAVRGEGEHAFAELVDALLNGAETKDIPNLCYRDAEGGVTMNPVRPLIQDLDVVPFEDWLDVEHHYELKNGRVRRKREFAQPMEGKQIMGARRNIFLFTARGCPFSCSYCMGTRLKRLNPHEQRVRKRSVRRIVERVERLRKAGPLDMVLFFDDDFLLRTDEEVREFSSEWKKRVRLPFFVYCSPRTVSEEKVRDLVDAGLLLINMGVQTGSERINREIYSREMTNEQALGAARMLHSFTRPGRTKTFLPMYGFIINNPYEKADDLVRTQRLIGQLPRPFILHMANLIMFQGTPLHERACRDGLVAGKDRSSEFGILDTPRHFRNLRARGGDYFCNSALFWLDGYHARSYGRIAEALGNLLTWDKAIRFCNAHPRLITFMNLAVAYFKKTTNHVQYELLRFPGVTRSRL